MECRCFKWRFQHLNCAFLPCPSLLQFPADFWLLGLPTSHMSQVGFISKMIIVIWFSPSISFNIFPFLQIQDKLKASEVVRLWKILQRLSSDCTVFWVFLNFPSPRLIWAEMMENSVQSSRGVVNALKIWITGGGGSSCCFYSPPAATDTLLLNSFFSPVVSPACVSIFLLGWSLLLMLFLFYDMNSFPDLSKEKSPPCQETVILRYAWNIAGALFRGHLIFSLQTKGSCSCFQPCLWSRHGGIPGTQALSIPAVSVAGCSACIPGIWCRLPELPAQPRCRLGFYCSNNSQACWFNFNSKSSFYLCPETPGCKELDYP